MSTITYRRNAQAPRFRSWGRGALRIVVLLCFLLGLGGQVFGGLNVAPALQAYQPGIPPAGVTLWTGTGGHLTRAGDTLYFVADDGAHSYELWKTDGTAAGTALVKDINPLSTCDAEGNPGGGSLPCRSDIEAMTDVNGTLFFKADDGTGPALWKSDGTAAGTVLVAEVEPDYDYRAYTRRGPIAVGSTLYFAGDDGTTGMELWKSDGTAAGTALVKDIDPASTCNEFGANPGSGSYPCGSDITALTNIGDIVYFSAENGLWKTDGTTAGTVMVKAISASHLTASGYTLFFAGDDGVSGSELWKSNGTEAGTVRVKDIEPGAGGSRPEFLTALNGEVLFRAWDSGTDAYRLWKSDGTEYSTFAVENVSPEARLVDVNGTLFFLADSGTGGLDLWKSDGTTAGTAKIETVDPLGDSYEGGYTDLDELVELVGVGDALFFRIHDGVHGWELWRSDGTAEGTGIVSDICPGSCYSSPTNMTLLGNTLYFEAGDGARDEVWALQVWNEVPGTIEAENYDAGGEGVAYHDTTAGNTGGEYRSDDVDVDAIKDSGGGYYVGWVKAGEWLAYTVDVATFGTHDLEVRVASARAGGTFHVEIGGQDVTGPLVIPNTGNWHAYEMLSVEVELSAGQQMMRIVMDTNGATNYVGNFDWVRLTRLGGPYMVKDIAPQGSAFEYCSYDTCIASAGDTLFFAVTNDAPGSGLWTSDGTEAGTILVKDLTMGDGILVLTGLTDVDGELYFFRRSVVFDPYGDATVASGPELWKSDGTTAGTMMVKDLSAMGVMDHDIMLGVNGTLFFAANDGTHGTELWKSDGTAAGTGMVTDINPGAGQSDPYGFTRFDGAAYFAANSDDDYGYELWKSDGTAAGTTLVADVTSSAFGVSGYTLTGMGDTLFFAADDGTHGHELWKSDGTAEGTVMVADVNPGAGSSYLDELAGVGTTLFFAADDGTRGKELWKSDGTAAGTVLVADINPGDYSSPRHLANVNGSLFFVAGDGVHGRELWKSDGTGAGTVLVSDINPGSSSSSPEGLSAAGDELFFTALDGVHGRELWKSDGTAAGTELVGDIRPGDYPSLLTDLIAVDGALFFRANDGERGEELWALPLEPASPYTWLEAEDGTIDSPMQVHADGAASGGQYIEVAAGENSWHSPPSDGRATYSFDVSTAGTYKVWGRVIATSYGNDSFWVRVDDGDWVKWNGIPQGSSWHWDDVHDNDNGNQPLEVALSAGSHTLTIAYREDGTKLDRLLITSDLDFVPDQ